MKNTCKIIKRGLDKAGLKITDKELIEFNYKVLLFLIGALVLFSFSVLLKLHGSSIGSWDIYVKTGGNGPRTIIGEPKGIRSDEWLVQTPFILSQTKKGLPVKNKALGGNKDPLLLSLPVKHYSAIFRPQNWGFFVFGTERAFSFYWNAKIFGLLVSTFLLLMLLTRNNFWASVLGSFWIYFSGFIQWWFSTSMPEMITYIFFVIISLVYILFSSKRSLALLSSAVLAISSINFALFFYPPFQIPLFYLSVFIILGFLLQKTYRQQLLKELSFKLLVLISTGLFVAAVFYFYYIDIKSTIEVVMNTVYPGRRVSSGGEMSVLRFFSGFTGLPIDEKRLPVGFENASEASNFLLLFPIVFLMLFREFALGIKIKPLFVTFSFYIFIITSWILIKTPELIARISLLGMAPSKRAMLGLGLASVLLVTLYLSERSEDKIDKSYVVFSLILTTVALTLYGFILKFTDPDFFRYRYIFLIVVVFSFVSYFLITRRKRLFALMIVMVVILPNFLINPLSDNLDFIYGKDISEEIAPLLLDKNSKTAVFGGYLYANLLKASGVNVFNGVNYTPKRNDLEVLDPEKKYEQIYNRYAHIGMVESKTNTDEVKFNLIGTDSYSIEIDPCSEKLNKIGIDRLVFTYQPDPKVLDCLVEVQRSSVNNILLYKYK